MKKAWIAWSLVVLFSAPGCLVHSRSTPGSMDSDFSLPRSVMFPTRFGPWPRMAEPADETDKALPLTTPYTNLGHHVSLEVDDDADRCEVAPGCEGREGPVAPRSLNVTPR